MIPGDRVRMVDRYGERRKCTCPAYEPSWFDGMTGEFVEMRGDRPLVLLDGDVGPTLLFATEVVLVAVEPHIGGAE